jgi:hypothetical protein
MSNISGSVALLTNIWLLDLKWRVMDHAPNHVRQVCRYWPRLSELSSTPLDTVTEMQVVRLILSWFVSSHSVHTHKHTHTHWLTRGFGKLSSQTKIFAWGYFGVRFFYVRDLGFLFSVLLLLLLKLLHFVRRVHFGAGFISYRSYFWS